MRELVRQALRMRPDRIVVGEVRGAEVVDLLAALNTGHDGGAGTVHANSPAEVPARLEALGALGGLDRAALHSQLAAAVQVLLHVGRDRDGRRRLAEIAVLRRVDGRVRAVTAWHADAGQPTSAAELHAMSKPAAGMTGLPLAALLLALALLVSPRHRGGDWRGDTSGDGSGWHARVPAAAVAAPLAAAMLLPVTTVAAIAMVAATATCANAAVDEPARHRGGPALESRARRSGRRTAGGAHPVRRSAWPQTRLRRRLPNRCARSRPEPD